MTADTFLIACVMDAMIGDPRWLPHPVRLMGQMIDWYEQRIRKVISYRNYELVAGIVLAVGLPIISYIVAWFAIDLAYRAHEIAGKIVAVLLAFTTIAARDLADHAVNVRRALDAGSLEEARTAVSQIVGRDTGKLTETGVVRATVETIAESSSDGIIAPFVYLILGGPPLAIAYKAINTLDSMVGHRDQRYRYFGWASARLDDMANLIPARVTALFLALSVGVVFRRSEAMTRALRILWRDGHKHPSPNSGWPEAAMAGALGIQLGGTNYYDDIAITRPVLGDAIHGLSPKSIRDALLTMWGTCILAAVIGLWMLW